jgi:predicted amidohydrolase YtcJ
MNAALWATLLAFSLASAAQEPSPDLILYNGKIFTSNAAHPYVQALAIGGERILATGDSTRIIALAGQKTTRFNLGGRTVIPGINDAHNHLGIGPANETDLEFKGFDPSWEEVKAKIGAAVAKTPKGTFIRGEIGVSIFHDVSVNRETLDKLAPEHPVILTSITGHAIIANSAALNATGIREDQPDPLGGRFERLPDGKLSGVLREYAAFLMRRNLANLAGEDTAIAQLRETLVQAAKFGITTIQDMSNAMAPERSIRLLQRVPASIRVRVIRMPMTTPAGRDVHEGWPTPATNNPLLRVSGTKWMLDGTPLEGTFLPRTDTTPVGEVSLHQPMTFSAQELSAMLRESLKSGDPLLLHVSGRPAPEAMLRAMEKAGGEKVWAGQRVRFEHGDGLVPDLIPAVKKMGIVVVQNATHFDAVDMVPGLGNQFSAPGIQPLGSLLAAGIPVALGSDGPTNPYLNIMYAVTHPDNPSEAITREQAVIAYTLTSAYAEFSEKEKGSLEPGKFADLAVLSQDIFTVSASDLPKTTSLLTLVGGKVVYDANVIQAIKGRPVPNTYGSPEMRTGDEVAQHIDVLFDPLPSEWMTEQNVMDPIWEPLGYKGVNYYAYGRALSGKSFAARSDPNSSLYQAWLGAYVIVGGKPVFGSGEKDGQCAAFAKLAEYDQKSWLAAMGDPHPLAESSATRNFLTIPIDGSERTGCSVEMATHSDVSSVDTPLAKHMGMPPEAEWEDRVSPFHDVDLHVVGAWWYDPHRDISVIVYTASSRFKNRVGLVMDNDSAIATSLRQIMQQTKLVDAGAVHGEPSIKQPRPSSTRKPSNSRRSYLKGHS